VARRLSKLAPDWWDYTTLDQDLLDEAARLKAEDLPGLSREGFRVVIYDTLEEFYLAEALEYIEAWRQATPDTPAGICGPIGPTEQLPLVARLVNALDLNLRHAHFWGMDEWVLDGREVPQEHPLSFARTDRELCFDRIRPELAMPEENLHFPRADVAEYERSWDGVRCVVMQGGQGDIKHWAFNDPVRREGPYRDEPPPPGITSGWGRGWWTCTRSPSCRTPGRPAAATCRSCPRRRSPWARCRPGRRSGCPSGTRAGTITRSGNV